jgi:hypothetical protein
VVVLSTTQDEPASRFFVAAKAATEKVTRKIAIPITVTFRMNLFFISYFLLCKNGQGHPALPDSPQFFIE